MNIKYKVKGVISIFLAGIFTIILSLILVVIDSAREQLISLRAQTVSNMAVESAFAEYTKEVFEEYGIFTLFMEEDAIIDALADNACQNLQNHIAKVFEGKDIYDMNIEDVSLESVKYIVDNDGEIFAKQVLEYMKYRLTGDAALVFLDQLQGFDSQIDVIDAVKLENVDKEVLTKLEENQSAIAKEYDENNVDKDLCSDEDYEKAADSLWNRICSIITDGLLNYICDSSKVISTESVDKTNLPSVSCQVSKEVAMNKGIYESQGTSIYENKDETIKNIILEGVEKASYMQYLKDTFYCYEDSKDKSALKYELEYIYAGEDNDEDNLKQTIVGLIYTRAGFNLLHILTNKDKLSQANKLGTMIGGSIPGINLMTGYIAASLWSIAEGIVDARHLLHGEKVPIFKTSSDWNLSIESLGNITDYKDSTYKNDNNGQTYKEYLEGMIFLNNKISMYYRTMDLIQLNINKNYCPSFSMRYCITGIDTVMEYSSKSLFSIPKRKVYVHYKNSSYAY